MYNIKVLNSISDEILRRELPKEGYNVSPDIENGDAILLRSANCLEMEFGPNLLAFSRAGAGTNNIPVDKCSEAGIAVFNTPGANANAVKEMVCPRF